MTTAIASTNNAINVTMGQVSMAHVPNQLSAVLGSCIAVTLYHPHLKTGIMAHVVLPNSAGNKKLPGKFADTAIPYMLEILKNSGVPSMGLVAKIAGGSTMFGNAGLQALTDSVVAALLQALDQSHLPVFGKHIGGDKGRRATFDTDTGRMTISVVGCEDVVI